MIEREVRQWILKALLAARRPVTDDFLRASIRGAFIQVAFTAGDLKQAIRECEDAGLIAGTEDDVLGLVWALTPAGKIKAQQL